VEFVEQKIPDVILIKPTAYGDERGYFVETFKQDLFNVSVGYQINFIQDNESKSIKGVLRGLHYQLPPYTQAKLVRVIDGVVLDVAVDIRTYSPTFGQYVAVELSSKNMHQLFVPRGFAHGFVVISESAIFSYKVDNYYSPEHERGIIFNDAELNIDWHLPEQELKISEKDLHLPGFSELISLDNTKK
jgi:dTDP-4-dehydrorhamnose 3,5-epimerase